MERVSSCPRSGDLRSEVALDAGVEIALDPADLADLPPGELKARVEYYAAHGVARPPGTNTVDPYPCLDRFGQWWMSDTNELIWMDPTNPGSGVHPSTTDVDPVEPEPRPELATDGAGDPSRHESGRYCSTTEGMDRMILEVSGTIDRISFDYAVEFLLSDGTLVKVEGDADLRQGDRWTAFSVEEPGSVVVDLLRLLHQAAELFVDDGSALRLVAGSDLELVVRPAEQYEAWTVNRADGSMIVCGPPGEMHRWT